MPLLLSPSESRSHRLSSNCTTRPSSSPISPQLRSKTSSTKPTPSPTRSSLRTHPRREQTESSSSPPFVRSRPFPKARGTPSSALKTQPRRRLRGHRRIRTGPRTVERTMPRVGERVGERTKPKRERRRSSLYHQQRWQKLHCLRLRHRLGPLYRRRQLCRRSVLIASSLLQVRAIFAPQLTSPPPCLCLRIDQRPNTSASPCPSKGKKRQTR